MESETEFIHDIENIQEQQQAEVISKVGEEIQTSKGIIHEDEAKETVEEILDAEDEEDFYELDKEGKIITNVEATTYGWKHQVMENRSRVAINSSMKENGLGKTHLSFWQGISILDKKHMHDNLADFALEGLNYSFEKNMFFRGTLEDIKHYTNRLSAGNIITIDEMLYLWYKRRAMSGQVVDLNEWMGAKQRKTQVIMIGNMPDFWDLDAYGRVKANTYIECLERGWALQFEADYAPHTDPWHEKELLDLQRMRSRRGSESLLRKIKIWRRHPCFKRVVNWRKMPPAAEMQYKMLDKFYSKESNKIDTKNKFEEWKDQFLREQTDEKFKVHRAIVNLVQLLETRGAKIHPILKNAGVSSSEIDKWTKEVRRVDGTILDKLMENKEPEIEKKEEIKTGEKPKEEEDAFENTMAD